MQKLKPPLPTKVMLATLVGFASVTTLSLGVTQTLSYQAQAPGALDVITLASKDCDPVNNPASCIGS